jgi:hypothetical protein
VRRHVFQQLRTREEWTPGHSQVAFFVQAVIRKANEGAALLGASGFEAASSIVIITVIALHAASCAHIGCVEQRLHANACQHVHWSAAAQKSCACIHSCMVSQHRAAVALSSSDDSTWAHLWHISSAHAVLNCSGASWQAGCMCCYDSLRLPSFAPRSRNASCAARSCLQRSTFMLCRTSTLGLTSKDEQQMSVRSYPWLCMRVFAWFALIAAVA